MIVFFAIVLCGYGFNARQCKGNVFVTCQEIFKILLLLVRERFGCIFAQNHIICHIGNKMVFAQINVFVVSA